jgi:hypothetical protein
VTTVERPPLTAERLREILCYDRETGVFTWKIWKGGTARANSVAGFRDDFGHIHVNVDGRGYLAHRLAWLHVYGEWPPTELTVDHKRGKSNAIENLRVVTQTVNMQNRHAAQKNNRLGVLGVDLLKTGYRARIKPPGKRSAVVHLGIFATPEEAHAAYVKAKRVLHEGGLL